MSWATLDTQTNQVFTSRYKTLSYAISNAIAYNLYRLQIDTVSNAATANSVQLSELEFIGNPAYRYWWSFGDGTESDLQSPQHTYASNGTYVVTLVVSDGTATASATATVRARCR